MVKLNKSIILPLVFLFSISISFGEIQINLPDDTYYNLGDKITPEASLKLDEARSGFFKMHIVCSTYNLQYYTFPLDVESGFRTQMNAPALSLSSPMLGDCALRADFDSINGERIDTVESKPFVVKKQLNINLSNELVINPGQELVISGIVTKYNGGLLEKGSAIISFSDSQYTIDINAGKIEHKIPIPSSKEAGIFPLTIRASDKYGNSGEQIFDVEILAIPTKIENQLSSSSIIPGNKLMVKTILFDHTNKILGNRTINVKVYTPRNQIIHQADVPSTESFEFATDAAQEPGAYLILSSFADIKGQGSFVVETVKKIEMKQENGVVFVRNIGNVDYTEEITILLNDGENQYALNKEISLKPKEQTAIDLSKEVPQGNYDIALPALADETGNNNLTEEAPNASQNVFTNVSIEDNRNTIKKVADGLDTITGAVVGAAGFVASRPTLATSLLILIIFATVLHYSWGYIKNRLSAKKKEETEKLVKDYQVEEDNKKEP